MTNVKISNLPMTSSIIKPTFFRPERPKTLDTDYTVDYPYVSKCRKKSSDFSITLSDGITGASWSDKDLFDGQLEEDSSRCSDYSSCSDLCSSPESSSDGYNVRRESFNTLPNHHNLLSPFSPFVRHGQCESQKTIDDRQSQSRNDDTRIDPASTTYDKRRGDETRLDDGENYSELSTFELSYKRLLVNYPGDAGHDDQKFFHPIQETGCEGGSCHRGSSSKDVDYLSLPDFVPKFGSDLNQNLTTYSSAGPLSVKGNNVATVDVAKSMTDLFSKDTPCEFARRYGMAMHNVIENLVPYFQTAGYW